MKKDKGKSAKATELHRRAEQRLRKRKTAATRPGTQQDALRLLHELQVHQVELEMQNEDLILARSEVEAGLERYTDLYDLAPVGYFTLDREGTIRQANIAGATLLGIERARLVRCKLGRFVAPDESDRWGQYFESVLRSAEKQTSELTFKRADGSTFYARLETVRLERPAPESPPGGSSLVVRVSMSDISDRKQIDDVQQFLLQCGRQPAREDFFSALARYLAQSLAMDFVCIDRLVGEGLSARTVAMYYDGKFQDNIEYALKDTPCGEVVGKAICCIPRGVRGLFPRDEVLQEMKAESYVGVTLRGYDGDLIGLIAVIGRKPLANPRMAELVLKLVSLRAAGELERAEAEVALREAHGELEHRVVARTTDLARTIETLEEEVARRTLAEASLRKRSDQLRALASELTLAEQRERQRLAHVLHDGLQQLLVGARFRLAVIERSGSKAAQRLAAEVNDLLLESIETSRSLTAELSPPILMEGGLVPALEWLAHWQEKKHGLAMSLQAHGDIGAMEEDLTVFLFQATRELLFNVVKHAGVKTARVQVARLGDHVQLIVADEGVGFEPAKLKAEGGSSGGFGLFSIQERLTMLGGRMEIASAPGQGSRFTLVAPLASAARSLPADGQPKVSVVIAHPDETTPAVAGQIRVVLVDDHLVMRQGLAALLKNEPDMVIVGEASDGESAVTLVRQIHPDVVIMDISMPGMNGIEATRIIHTELPEVRVIGLSMFEQMERAEAIRRAGAVGYLAKSGPSNAVVDAVRACAGHQAVTKDQ
jgi:PAS domain S-box-containing protein